jgi:hypothetical protein
VLEKKKRKGGGFKCYQRMEGAWEELCIVIIIPPPQPPQPPPTPPPTPGRILNITCVV